MFSVKITLNPDAPVHSFSTAWTITQLIEPLEHIKRRNNSATRLFSQLKIPSG